MILKIVTVFTIIFLPSQLVWGDDPNGSVGEANNKSQNTSVINMVLASIDGEPVTLTELQRYMTAQGEVSVENVQSGDKKIREYLRELILTKIFDKEAEKAGITVSPDEITAYIEEIKAQNNFDDAQMLEFLSSKGLTLETYSRQVSSDIIRTRVISARIKTSVNVVESDVREYLEKHPERIPKAGTVHLQQISLKFSEDDEASKHDELKAQITQFEEALKLGGAFDKVGGSAFSDLGFVEEEELRAVFKAIVSGLQPGEFSEIVETLDGFYIFKLLAKTDDGESLSPQLIEEVRRELYQAKFKEEVDKFLNQDLPSEYNVELKL